MSLLTESLNALHNELQRGQALGLDVLFSHLDTEARKVKHYPAPKLRYALQEVDPLQPNYPGSVPQAASALAQALAAAQAEALQLPGPQQQEALLTVLERFGGWVAARDPEGKEVGGVSWFDQARLQIALEACGEEVLVLRADLSGIQDFIYQDVEASHLKNLRARSFYLELLSIHVLRRLLALADVTRANVAFVGGGGFQLYLPVQAEAKVNAYLETFNVWLWQQHSGDLNLVTAVTRVSRDEALQGGDFQRTLSNLLSAKKARRLQGNLAQLFGVTFDPTQRLKRQEELNASFVDFGTRLAGAQRVEVSPLGGGHGPNGSVTIHDRTYLPSRQKGSAILTEDRLALNTLRDLGGFPMLSGNYVTRGLDVPEWRRNSSSLDAPRNVVDHDQLADLALGQRRLALFRCDADNMGQFFSGGIPGHTAARHATLSRLMSLFFQGYVNAICAQRGPLLPEIPQVPRSASEEHGRYLNIIYSGGDDAVVVGAWNEVLSFSVDLRRAYAEFTGHNPQLGLSGGSFIAKPKFPLKRMAERAEDAEKLAKQARRPDNGDRKPDKDGFVPFLQAETPGEGRGLATRWDLFMTMQGKPALPTAQAAAAPAIDYQDMLLQSMGLGKLKAAAQPVESAPAVEPAAPGQTIEATLGLLAAFLELTDSERSSELGIELLTHRNLLGHLQRFAEGDKVWRLPQLHYALARAQAPQDAQEKWQTLKSTLLLPGTWPHLAAVLAFLHLARPEAWDKLGKVDIQKAREQV